MPYPLTFRPESPEITQFGAPKGNRVTVTVDPLGRLLLRGILTDQLVEPRLGSLIEEVERVGWHGQKQLRLDFSKASDRERLLPKNRQRNRQWKKMCLVGSPIATK